MASALSPLTLEGALQKKSSDVLITYLDTQTLEVDNKALRQQVSELNSQSARGAASEAQIEAMRKEVGVALKACLFVQL